MRNHIARVVHTISSHRHDWTQKPKKECTVEQHACSDPFSLDADAHSFAFARATGSRGRCQALNKEYCMSRMMLHTFVAPCRRAEGPGLPKPTRKGRKSHYREPMSVAVGSSRRGCKLAEEVLSAQPLPLIPLLFAHLFFDAQTEHLVEIFGAQQTSSVFQSLSPSLSVLQVFRDSLPLRLQFLLHG
jgi:hypothetical protein